MAAVAFEQVSRRYAKTDRPAVDHLDLAVEDGEFLVLVGPSGCGKTTTLRMLAGLEPVDSGRITIGEQDVTHADPRHRDIAMVFQNYGLYPHMTVAQNMGFGLKIAKTPKKQLRERVLETARLLGLEEYLDRKPKDLSGGQRQRAAMGRAIVRRPRVFLLDEPLSNLDAKLRVQTRAQIAQLQRTLATTTVYVTHDQVEAMTMGHRVAVLRDGVLQQCAPPRELYHNPTNAFVASFLGSPPMNLFPTTITDNAITLGDYHIPVPRTIASHTDETILGIRPEHLELADTGIRVEVDLVEELGADTHLHCHLPNTDTPLIARTGGASPTPGTRLHLRPNPDHLYYFSPHADNTRLSG